MGWNRLASEENHTPYLVLMHCMNCWNPHGHQNPLFIKFPCWCWWPLDRYWMMQVSCRFFNFSKTKIPTLKSTRFGLDPIVTDVVLCEMGILMTAENPIPFCCKMNLFLCKLNWFHDHLCLYFNLNFRHKMIYIIDLCFLDYFGTPKIFI